MPTKRRLQLRRLALGVLLSVATAAARKAGAEGTCDADAKGVVAAGKKLGAELKEMHQVEGLGSIADVSRTWRLVRNQQEQVEEAFAAVNARFSAAIRKLSGVETIKTDDKAQVEELFFGGEPFFVQCAAPVDKLRPILEQRLQAVKLLLEHADPLALMNAGRRPAPLFAACAKRKGASPTPAAAGSARGAGAGPARKKAAP